MGRRAVSFVSIVMLVALPEGIAFSFRSGPRLPGTRSLRRRRPHAMRATVEGSQNIGLPKLFNTASREKQPLRPQSGRRVKFYSCGPTVYDAAHVGNFRAFLTYDVLKRWLLYRGYDVEHVCNLTDVDDKIIQRMQRDGVGLKELTNKYADLFFEDLAALNIIPARIYPRATDHIPEIVAMVQGLVECGLAYERDGSYYFRVAAFPRYGALANLRFEGMQDGASEGSGSIGPSDADDYEGEKESAKDFALWKAYKPSDGAVFWETALGKGRPGWHIECSAMARKYLGDSLDLHAGGVDLVFPHHENEVAQSEGLSGRPFCGCWVHNGFVNVGGEKMSKSKGNFLTLRGCLKTAEDVRAFRYLVVTSQYRTPLNFTPEALGAARNALRRLDKLRAALLLAVAAAGAGAETEEAAAMAADAAVAGAIAVAAAAAATATAAGVSAGVDTGEEVVESTASGTPNPELLGAVRAGLAQFEAAMDDDLNTARAAAGLFAVVKAGERAVKAAGEVGVAAADADVLLRVLDGMDAIFGIFYKPAGFAAEGQTGARAGSGAEAGAGEQAAAEAGNAMAIPAEVATLLEKRAAAKAARDWGAADTARDAITALGFEVKDAKGGGVRVTRARELGGRP